VGCFYKAFTTQITVLTMLFLRLAKAKANEFRLPTLFVRIRVNSRKSEEALEITNDAARQC
jgi:glucosamine 6-phosphate synthetase-like amidotransferase/phosphosugar isomerase protein